MLEGAQMQFCLPLMNGTKLLTVALRFICSIFFDLQKAFDNIPHHLLPNWVCWTSVNSYSSGSLTTWLIGVSVFELMVLPSSPPLPVFSGVPQGSVLGPLLFTIYIAGLTDVLSNSSMSLYADVLLPCKPIYFPSDYQALQADIDALSDLIPAPKLQFNGDKCRRFQKRDSTMLITLLVNG